jgi:hypothetical protein
MKRAARLTAAETSSLSYTGRAIFLQITFNYGPTVIPAAPGNTAVNLLPNKEQTTLTVMLAGNTVAACVNGG